MLQNPRKDAVKRTVTSVKVVYVASSGLTVSDYAACLLGGAGFSALGSSSTSSRLMVM
jgi:hypothetical protein